MTHQERQHLIDFIKANDTTYDYSAVNFRYYSDEELLALKNRIEAELELNRGLGSKDKRPPVKT
jgi:hypothetical protein